MRPTAFTAALATAVLTLLAVVAVAPASATPPVRPLATVDDPAGTVTVTPTGASTVHEVIHPLAGSARWLVYTLTLRPGPDGTPGFYEQNQDELFVRSRTGRTADLGPVPPGHRYGLSLVGDLFTQDVAVGLGDDEQITYWNLATGQTGHIDEPAHTRFLTGSADGALLRPESLGSGGDLLDVAIDGTVTDLGPRPFGGSVGLSAVAGDTGAVFSDETNAVFMPFGQPPTYRRLLVGTAYFLRCQTVTAAYVGCVDAGPDVNHVRLIPLDGTRPAQLVPASPAMGLTDLQVSITGSTLLFTQQLSPDSPALQVRSVRYGTATVAASDYRTAGDVVSAFGAVATTDLTFDQLSMITSAASAPQPLVAAPFSPIASPSFSLSPGRLVYTDDRPLPGADSNTSSLFGAAVATDAAAPTVGATRTIQADSSPTEALGSGTTTVYGLRGSGRENLMLRAPRNSTRLPYSGPGGTLSGNRFLDAEGYVYDASTGTRSQTAVTQYPGSPLSGQNVAYLGGGGAIRVRNLVTGASVQVSGALNMDPNAYVQIALYAHGDYVGWNYTRIDDDNDVHIYAYRNVKTMAPIVTLPQPIQQISDAGVTLASHSGDAHNTVSYSLLTWSGRSVPLLPTASYYSAPQITGTTMAWSDEQARLKVASLDVPTTAPRFLGATIAPTALHSPGHVGWQAWAPFSAPLTSCSVVISRGSADLRRLPCNATLMPIGSANFSWDGRYGGHVAPAGTYRYRIVAAGKGGPVQNVFGDVAAPVATIKVG